MRDRLARKLARKWAEVDGKWRPYRIDDDEFWLKRAEMVVPGKIEKGIDVHTYYVVEGDEWVPARFPSEAEALKTAGRFNRQLARKAAPKEDGNA
jgi:hypothetical protein